MIFDWFKSGQRLATLKEIYISPAAGADMQSVNSANAISGKGLEGDRYCTDEGYWKSIEGCQVTLICERDINQAVKGASGLISESIINGGHRRNLVIDGIKIKELEGKNFKIGESVFSYEKSRPPCGHIDKVAGQGMCKALGHHSGICIKVIKGGVLSVGDVLDIIDV